MNIIIQSTLIAPEHIAALLSAQATRNSAGITTLTLSIGGNATTVEVLHVPNKNDPKHEEKMATMLKNCAAIFYFPSNHDNETFYIPSLTDTTMLQYYGLASKYYVFATGSLAEQTANAQAISTFQGSPAFKDLEKLIALQLAQVHLDDPSTLNDLFVKAIERHQKVSANLRDLDALRSNFMSSSSATDKTSFVAYNVASSVPSGSQSKNEAPAPNKDSASMKEKSGSRKCFIM